MASGFGRIVIGTYVEIKRSDGRFFIKCVLLSFRFFKLLALLLPRGSVATVVPGCSLSSDTVSVRAESFNMAIAFE